MPGSHPRPTDDANALDALDVLAIATVLVDVDRQHPTVTFANHVARGEFKAARGQALATLASGLHMDAAARADLLSAATERRAGEWRWSHGDGTEWQARFCPLPQRPDRPRSGCLTWERVRRAGRTDDLAVPADGGRPPREVSSSETQKLEAIGALAGGVAHDFNNILTAVLGFAGVLRDMAVATGPQRDLIAQILNAAERGAGLTRQLLAFGRRQVVRPEVFDLAANLRELEPLLRRLLGPNVLLVVDAPAPGCILADRAQVEQAVLNLVTNAGEAMPNGGELRLAVAAAHAEAGAPTVILRVQDTGIGIAPAVRAHLFEPFFTTKAKGQGTGLGLATVYGIVTQSGGSIRVDSAVGAGTTFELCWPRATAVATTTRTASRRRGRILLVEDDAANRELASRVLRKQGHTVLEAATGEAALAIAQQDPAIDMLVTDVVMPGIGGRAVAQRLTAAKPGLRVLFVSGYLADDALRRELDATHVALLQKPFSAEELTTTVDRVLNE